MHGWGLPAEPHNALHPTGHLPIRESHADVLRQAEYHRVTVHHA